MAAAMATALLGMSTGANADLFLNGELAIGAQGFGTAPRLLTIESQNNNTFESGAIGISGGSLVALTPGVANTLVFMGNGVTNVGGDTVSPLSDNQKFGIPTLGSLNWTSGANVNLLFNATEPGGDGLNVTDVTLKFYNGNTLLTAIDGSFALASSVVGNGSAGFLVSVTPTQQAHLNTTVFNLAGSPNFRIALESTITGVAGGAESFSAVSAVSPIPEPETYALMLAGLGLMGMVGVRRSKSS
jgi:hypothetical protein